MTSENRAYFESNKKQLFEAGSKQSFNSLKKQEDGFPSFEEWKKQPVESLKKFANLVAKRFVAGMKTASVAIAVIAIKIKSGLSTALTKTGVAIKSAFQSMGSAFKSLWNGFKSTVIKVANYVDSKLGISEKAKAIGAVCSAFFKKVKDLGVAAGKAIAKGAKTAGKSVKDFVQKKIIEPLGRAVGTAKSFVDKLKEQRTTQETQTKQV